MGWAARWLRGFFGFGRKASSSSGQSKPEKEKRRWGFGKSFREKAPSRSSSSILATPRHTYDVAEEGEEEQSKRAIAVAVATAAVADAAVAAAQAAAAVVRLTSSGRCMSSVARQEWGATRIQAAFRGYLARQALKALRGLVKMQALVRGDIVRRQAAKTLQCMHALVRVQARARARRSLRSQRGAAHRGITRASEMYDQAALDATKSDFCGYLKRSSSKTSGGDRLGRERSQSFGRNWLDGWTEESCMDDENSKILELDSSKSGRHSSRRHGGRGGGNQLQSSSSTMTSDQNSRSFATVPESPSNDSTATEMSVPSPPFVGMGEHQSPWQPPIDIAGLSATSRPGSSRRGPFTPTQSECSRSLYGGYSDYPNYMANTESFRAKARSQSAPKQRLQYDKSGLTRKAPAAQTSASIHAKFTSKAYSGSGRLDRLGLASKQ